MFSLELKSSEIRRRIVANIFTLNLVTAVFALAIIPSYFNSASYYSLSYTLLVFFYGLLMYLLVSRLIYYKNSACCFKVNSESISIPKVLFPKLSRTIKLDDVTSAEFLSNDQKIALVIGLRNRYPKILHIRLFQNENDLVKLEELLNQYIKNSKVGESSTLKANLSGAHSELRKREYSIALLALFLGAVYVLTTKGLSDSALDDYIISIGANTRGIVSDFELYRLFSSFTLHYNTLHLLSNITAFAFIGQFIVRLLGTIGFLNTVLFSSVVAVIFSNVFIGSNASLGSSGGVFGLMGAYTVIKFKYQKHLPATLNPIPNWMFIFILFIEICIGYYFEAIDLYNHLGGYFAGVLSIYSIEKNRETLFGEPTVPEKMVFTAILVAYAWGISRFFALLYC